MFTHCVFLFFFFFFSTETGIGLIPPMCTTHIQHGFLECSRLVLMSFFVLPLTWVDIPHLCVWSPRLELREFECENWRLMMVYTILTLHVMCLMRRYVMSLFVPCWHGISLMVR